MQINENLQLELEKYHCWWCGERVMIKKLNHVIRCNECGLWLNEPIEYGDYNNGTEN